jgi:hypothetical protein
MNTNQPHRHANPSEPMKFRDAGLSTAPHLSMHKHVCFRGRLALAARIVADGFCPSLPCLCDIVADPKPEPLIEPRNATAIGQGHGHMSGTSQGCQNPEHTLRCNPATAIRRVLDDIQHLGHVWVATDSRESHQCALGRVGRDVVAADAQHVGRFSLGAAVMTVPPDDPVEGIQLGHVNGAVFREGDAC